MQFYLDTDLVVYEERIPFELLLFATSSGYSSGAVRQEGHKTNLIPQQIPIKL